MGRVPILLPWLFLILTNPSVLSCVTWHLFCHLSSSLSLCLYCSAVFSLSCPIPLSSPFHPDVNASIMWSTCTSCWSLPFSSVPSLPLPLSVTDPCVCVRVCETWAYGVPSCQHMPGGFSMPILADTHMCVCCQDQHAAVCRDKGLFPWFLLSSCHPPFFCFHCVLYPFSS